MKKYVVILSLGLFVWGCGPSQPPQKTVLIRVNNYEITREEFEQEFKDSRYGTQDTPQARDEFLNNLISRKLILQEAQAAGLDKDKAFLKLIEKFWEQSLLKIYLDQKTKQIDATIGVDDKIVEAVYNKMVAQAKTDKPYAQMHDQIKREIFRVKEASLFNDWLASLRKSADIKISDDLLNRK